MTHSTPFPIIGLGVGIVRYGLCIICQTHVAGLTAKSSPISSPLLVCPPSSLHSGSSVSPKAQLSDLSLRGSAVAKGLSSLSHSLSPKCHWTAFPCPYHMLVLLADSWWSDLAWREKTSGPRLVTVRSRRLGKRGVGRHRDSHFPAQPVCSAWHDGINLALKLQEVNPWRGCGWLAFEISRITHK